MPSRGKSSGILVSIKNEDLDVGSFTQGEYMVKVE
jgi:hypothetical protein